MMQKRVIILLVTSVLIVGGASVLIEIMEGAKWWSFPLPFPESAYYFPFGEYKGYKYPTTYYIFFISIYLNLGVFSYIIYDLCKKHYPLISRLAIVIFLFITLRLIIFLLYSYATIVMHSATGGIFLYSLFILVRKWRKY